MAKAPDTSGYERFSDVTARLDEIIADVRKKDTSLERSLDLFDEAIALGTLPRSASAWPSPSRRRMPMKARRPPASSRPGTRPSTPAQTLPMRPSSRAEAQA